MNYDFSKISPTDFEDLARDLLGRELRLRFEAFTAGRDDGIDGRYASVGGTIILQAKRYQRSGFAQLKAVMKKERQVVDALQAKRYILVTSTGLTPNNKAILSEIIGPSLQSIEDIWGPEDLNALLRKYPDVERMHPELWMSSAGVLQTLINNSVDLSMSKQSGPTLLQSISKADECVLNEIINMFNKNNGLHFIREFAFGDSFESSSLNGVSCFVYDQRPEKYFSDRKIEGLRLDLLSVSKDFLSFLNANVSQTADPGRLNVRIDLRRQNQTRYVEIIDTLNKKATIVFEAYKKLVCEAKCRMP
ncbi:hypothetical protein HKD27_15960 [Gluconobacter sp. R75690]|uniref:restriction endonuclease n=1 Tax=unclassified Gluconobacter TaxID=2644261 RepID=UPI00188A282F|nr:MULTISPECIES: restriction endonuclease [unclassified Gluconobacter]MBF0852374.1 hypothetical protein [Gluconobacter sp. R75690]MBF0881055.1 hypothetical protein [Gluconobacter sp. R75828]